MNMVTTFKQTSDEPYDRHHYRLVYKTKQSIICESWEELRYEWWNTPAVNRSHVDVLDIQNIKSKKSNGGFK